MFNHDVSPPSDFLDMFLLTICQGLLSGDEVTIKDLQTKIYICVLGYYLCDYKFM